MIKEQYKISATDREACNWESLLARSPRNECSAYAALFREQMALEQEIGNNAYTEIYRLLVFVSDIRLQNNNDGLQPFICFDRSFDIIQVADGHMQFLIDSGLSINDPEMRARVCDLVWMRDKKNHLHGRAAVLAYLDAAVTLKDFDQWTDFFDRVRRAFQIARFIEKKGELAQKVIQFVENTIKTHYHEDPLF